MYFLNCFKCMVLNTFIVLWMYNHHIQNWNCTSSKIIFPASELFLLLEYCSLTFLLFYRSYMFDCTLSLVLHIGIVLLLLSCTCLHVGHSYWPRWPRTEASQCSSFASVLFWSELMDTEPTALKWTKKM